MPSRSMPPLELERAEIERYRRTAIKYIDQLQVVDASDTTAALALDFPEHLRLSDLARSLRAHASSLRQEESDAPSLCSRRKSLALTYVI